MTSIEDAVDIAQDRVESINGIRCATRARKWLMGSNLLAETAKDCPEFLDGRGFIFKDESEVSKSPPGIPIGFLPVVREGIKNDDPEAWSTVNEEISHFCYSHFYIGQYGCFPDEANSELIASIDKSLIMGMESFEDKVRCWEGFYEKEHPIDYVVGHYFGRIYAFALKALKQQDSKKAMRTYREFYRMSNKEQITFLLGILTEPMHFHERLPEAMAYLSKHYGIKGKHPMIIS